MSSKICSTRCFGTKGNHGGCCQIYDREWIIGEIDDADEFLERLQKHFDADIKYSDVFIDYEEGKALFPERETWQNMENYPALRVNTALDSNPCIFYNVAVKRCTVYDIRPTTCIDYRCDYLERVKGP